jgi:hypothetical protein
MKRSNSKNDKRSHSQRTGHTPEKAKKNKSFTQGDIPEDIDDILMEINLKKPKSAYNFYIQDCIAKDESSMIEAVKKYSGKFAKISNTERKKYEDMASKDKERYQTHMELVRKHLISKPLKQSATAYAIFLDEKLKKAIDNDEDTKEAKKDASAAWKAMSSEERKEYEDKKRDHMQHYKDLKQSVNASSAYNLFCKEQMEKAREKDSTMSLKECGEAWKKSKSNVKDKYTQFAEEQREERTKNRDLYELAYGVKPRRPLGAYKFFLMEAAKDGKLGKNPIKEGAKLFKKLSESEKERYQKIAQKAKLIYIVKKLEYESTIKKSNPARAPSARNLFYSDLKGKVNSKEFSKEGFFNYAHKKWSKLDEISRKKFVKMAEDAKKEFESEKEKLKSRVYDMPKRPGNGYTLYLKEVLPDLQAAHPKKSSPELFKIVAEDWQNMSDKNKEKYANKHKKLMDAYYEGVKDFEETGFYTKDGKTKPKNRSKSSESQSQKRGKKSTKA